jgi:hypothetical protein
MAKQTVSLNQVPAPFTSEILAGGLLVAPGRMRFSLNGVPERERPFLLREVFGRELTKYDLEPLPDVPLEVDLEFQALPGLLMMSGTEHGLCTTRTLETLAADATDDISLVVNLGGSLRITHGQGELLLGDGEAVMVSLADVCGFTHQPPGGLLDLRMPRGHLASLVTGLEDLCYRQIPDGTPALRFLRDYVRTAQDDQRIACPDLQHLFVRHVQDLMALALGATRDGAEMAKAGGLRAAKLNAIKQDIATNLDQPGLSVATLAARHGCTPRFIQRLFETDGTTFTDHVLEQRLARAHRVLTDTRRVDDKISVVA